MARVALMGFKKPKKKAVKRGTLRDRQAVTALA